MKRFGEKLRALRMRHGLTIRELAEILGFHNTYINKIETGKRSPSAKMILKVTQLFNVSADQLIRDDLELDD